MLGPATDMTLEVLARFAGPSRVEISAYMVGAGWIPVCDVLIDSVM